MGNCFSLLTERFATSPVEEGVKVFTMVELKKATKNFGKERVIGESYGKVVRGYINPKTLSPDKEGVGMAVAFKRFYLKYEEALQKCLEFNAKVSYFGLKMVDSLEDCSHIPSSADGSARICYAPPEYIFSGISHMAGDVYSFGVILLEILTGLSNPCIILAKQATQNGKENIAEMIDPELENSYPVDEGMRMCKLIKQCLERDPKERPSMQEVLDNLNAIAQI